MPKKQMIVIVDDDELAREGTIDLVKSMGFIAKAFERAEDFLKSDYLHSSSCLIADVLMPELDRPGLAEQLQAVRPDVRVVFMSAEWVPEGVYPFVQKPFLPSALMSTIRDALAQPPHPLCHNS